MADPNEWPLPPSNLDTTNVFAHSASNGTITFYFQSIDHKELMVINIKLNSISYQKPNEKEASLEIEGFSKKRNLQ